MPIVLAVILYFVVESYVLFLVAAKIGFLATLLILVLAAFIGSAIARSQGLGVFSRANGALMQGQSPQVEIVEGVILLLCGIILVIPGFVSDILVLPLLIPALRRAVARRMLIRLTAQSQSRSQTIYEYDSASAKTYAKADAKAPAKASDSTQGNVRQTHTSSYTSSTSSGSPFVFYRFFVSSSNLNPGLARDELENKRGQHNAYQTQIDNQPQRDDQPEVIDCTVIAVEDVEPEKLTSKDPKQDK